MADLAVVSVCKKSLNIASAVTAFDDRIQQKASIVKGYMRNAGVSETVIESDMAVGVVALGVVDLWSLDGGAASFSPVFHTLLTQLACISQPAPDVEEG